ncbi:MAG: hypothetical protein NDJ89_02510 [Oligoflexia bacterium]|nr:hypothetical protein [Oligoflexia bacterium]
MFHNVFQTTVVLIAIFLGGTSAHAANAGSIENLDRYSREIVLSFPDDNGGVAYRVPIRVILVHPNVAIHYFKKDEDPYMYLNHGKDTQGNRFYNAILYPVIGMKSYVVPFATLGPVMPEHLLDKDSREILALQLSEIQRYGGLKPYADMLEKRGFFED